ncbi:MAG: hypothetical protein QOJ12_2511 [Thermoleophilales bacterium]|nr:hypothetical protein [Thermoleophilales bacterium]
MPLAIRLALVAMLVLVAPAEAQAPDPTTLTRNAIARLVTDTQALTAADANDSTRAAALTDAQRIDSAAVPNPCRAIRLVADYRRVLAGVNGATTPGPGGAPGPPSVRGKLDRDALAVDAGIRQFPRTRRCGGGASTATVTTLDSRPAQSSRKVLRLRLRLPRARWEAFSGAGRDFIGLNMDNADALGTDGDPGVPAFTRLFAVPRGASLTVRVARVRGYTLPNVAVMPKQPQAVDGLPPDFPPAETFADKPFKIRQRAYSSAGKVPARLAFVRTLGQLRDVTVAGVQIPGAQYDRKTRDLRVFTSMDVTIVFKHPGRWQPKRARTAREAPFRRIYSQALENYSTVARSPEVRASGTSDADAQAVVPPCGEEYLIVTSPALRPAADKLAQAKTAAGYIVGTHEVAPGTAADDVRTFIRGELNNDNCARPSYVVLVGDTSHVPSFLEVCPGIDNCQVTSDLSYSLDGIGTDGFADVMLGRIPANTLDVADRTITKIVNYQTQLPAPPGDDFYNHATVTSNFDGLGPRDGRGFTLSAERFRAGLRSRGHVVTRLNTAQSTADIQTFKDNTPIPDELKRPATPWTDGRDQVVSELNAGRFLFLHRDHGSRLGWANPGININDIGRLNSDSTKLPFVIAMNCSSAGFGFPGNPSFDEQLLQRQGGGAVAVIGDTEVSPTVQNDQLTVGFADAMFPQTVPAFGAAQPLTHLGEILNAGKAYMASLAPASAQLTGQVYREHLLWHLLGDPSMELRSATPQEFNPTLITAKFEHRRDTFPVGDPPFRVRVTLGQAGTDGTIATLLHGTEVVGRATSAGGVALITPSKRTDSATLSVALERDGFIPPQPVPVAAPVPNLTMTCPTEVDVPQQDNALVTGTLSPKASGATILLRATRPNGTVTTHSTTTDANSTWKIKIAPVSNADLGGRVKIEAFFDGALKYGADDAVCTVPVT